MAQEHSIVGHLEDLRKRIIFILVFFLAALIASFAFIGSVYDFLVAPAHGMRLAVLGPGDVVQIYLMIAGAAALAVTTPFLLWQLWLFVAPGLLPRERRYALRLIAPITVMFLVGVSFGYLLVFPEIFHFLKTLAQERYRFILTATEYFSFMINIVLPFGLLFELPVVVLFLTRIGLLSPKWLRKMRRYAYFLCVVLGTLISPPELISHLSVTVPMILIYEASIGISALVYRKKLKAEAWWREDGQPVAEATIAPEFSGDREEDGNDDDDDDQPGSAIVPSELIVEEFHADRRRADHLGSIPILPRRPGLTVEERE